VDRQLERAQAALEAAPADPVWSRTLEALQTQRATAQRLDGVIDGTRSELRLLNARMGEAVARTIELSAHAATPELALSLSTDVESVVTDLEALRQALEETNSAGALGAGGPAGALGEGGPAGAIGPGATGPLRHGEEAGPDDEATGGPDRGPAPG
jgi:hypothetical protein